MDFLKKKITGAVVMCVLFLSPALSRGFGTGYQSCESPYEPVNIQSPTIITNCTEAGIQAALDSGGHISFDCGATPVVIPIQSVLTFSPLMDTVLDGGGLVTLDGQNSTRLFFKGWNNEGVENITITLQNLRVVNGRAQSGENHGGVFYGGYHGLRLHIFNSEFEDNSTTDITTEDNQGGAIFIHNAYETVISGSSFINNRAGNGGAYGAIGSDLYIYNSYFSGNEAADTTSGGIVRGHGGAIHLDGAGRGEDADRTTDNRVQICGSVFENNSSVRGGGALKVTISDNRNILASYRDSTFIGNSSSGPTEGHGGAIYHIEDDREGGSDEDNIELSGCFFQNNSGYKQGGGAWFSVLGHLSIFNNTFVDNYVTRTESLGMGGALAIGGSYGEVINNTFVRNFAAFHGGAIQASDTLPLLLKNNLFHYNESTREWACYQLNLKPDNDALIDGGGNIQYPAERYNQANNSDDCLVTTSSEYSNSNVEEPADNGGPTLTMALPAASLAVNGGSSGAPSTDQRGFSRDDSPDIGAYEYGSEPLITVKDVILSLRVCAGYNDDLTDLSMVDINDDGKIGMEEVVNGLRSLAADDN